MWWESTGGGIYDVLFDLRQGKLFNKTYLWLRRFNARATSL